MAISISTSSIRPALAASVWICPGCRDKAARQVSADTLRGLSIHGKRNLATGSASTSTGLGALRSARGHGSLRNSGCTSSTYRPVDYPRLSKDGRAAALSTAGVRRSYRLSKTEHSLSPRRHVKLLTTGRSHRASTADVSASTLRPTLPDQRLGSDIRSKLKEWQQVTGDSAEDTMFLNTDLLFGSGSTSEGHALSQDHNFDAEDITVGLQPQHDADDGLLAEISINVGDLVAFTIERANQLLAVKVCQYTTTSVFLCSDGRWFEIEENKVAIRVPGWSSPESIEPLIPFAPPAEMDRQQDSVEDSALRKEYTVPRSLSGPFITRMVDLLAKVNAVYRKNVTVLDRAYELLAHDRDLRFGTLTSIAASLLSIDRSEVKVETSIAVYRALASDPAGFFIDSTMVRVSGYIQIRPKEESRVLANLTDIIRAWQQDPARQKTLSKQHRLAPSTAIIEEFLDKARKIVHRSRCLRKVESAGTIGPLEQTDESEESDDNPGIVTHEAFTPLEQRLLWMLESWSCQRLYRNSNTLQALPIALLEATGLYAHIGLSEMHAIGWLFLQELGVVAPWETNLKNDPNWLLPITAHSRPLRRLADKLKAMEHDHSFTDDLADLRHDWGDLPVYCIDSLTTRDHDDGMSIEPGPNHAQDGSYWLRVHVANPAAYLSRDSPITAMARHMTESVFLPEGQLSMLPLWAKHKYWNLAPNRACLTFSALLDKQGNILDKDIRAGIVRNVKVMPGELLDDATRKRLAPARRMQSLVVGSLGSKNSRLAPTLERTEGIRESSFRIERGLQPLTIPTPDDLHKLNLMADLLAQKSLRRSEQGAQMYERRQDIAISTRIPHEARDIDIVGRSAARTFRKDAFIAIDYQPDKDITQAAVSVPPAVAEAMFLAGQIASQWATERAVPLLHRVSDVSKEELAKRQKAFEASHAATIARCGGLPVHLQMATGRVFGLSLYSTRARDHVGVGLNAYCKITSPMRRYSDLVNQWQLGAALRLEAKTGKTLKEHDWKTLDTGIIPYDDAAMQGLAEYLMPRERMSAGMTGLVSMHYIYLALHHAIKRGQTDAPTNVTITILSHRQRENGSASMVYLHDFGTKVRASVMRPLEGVQIGDRWEALIEDVNCFSQRLYLRLDNLVMRFDD